MVTAHKGIIMVTGTIMLITLMAWSILKFASVPVSGGGCPACPPSTLDSDEKWEARIKEIGQMVDEKCDAKIQASEQKQLALIKELQKDVQSLRESLGAFSEALDSRRPTAEKHGTEPRIIGAAGYLAPMDTMANLLIKKSSVRGLVSAARKQITVKLAMAAIFDELEGDFVETGVFNGGTSILMAKVLATYATDRSRCLWSCDSFKGFPEEDRKALDAGDQSDQNIIGWRPAGFRGKVGDFASGLDVFKNNIKSNGLDDFLKRGRIKILEGFFNTTLPTAPISKISFLRLDGDIYVSTWQALIYLYGKLTPGGYIYVDDYGSYEGCKKAVDKYRKEHKIYEPLIPVYEDASGKLEAVWWRKSHRRANGL